MASPDLIVFLPITRARLTLRGFVGCGVFAIRPTNTFAIPELLLRLTTALVADVSGSGREFDSTDPSSYRWR